MVEEQIERKVLKWLNYIVSNNGLEIIEILSFTAILSKISYAAEIYWHVVVLKNDNLQWQLHQHNNFVKWC